MSYVVQVCRPSWKTIFAPPKTLDPELTFDVDNGCIRWKSEGKTRNISLAELFSIAGLSDRLENIENRLKIVPKISRDSQLREEFEELEEAYKNYKNLEEQCKVLNVLGEE